MNKTTLRKTNIFLDYYERLKNIALSVFEWDNLPDSCNARFLEECLYYYGRAIFVDDVDLSYLTLNATPSDMLNVYREPMSFTAYSINYSKQYKNDECIYIRNNYLEKPTDLSIVLFAEKLARIELSILANINAQKTPILIRTDEKTKISLTNLYKQYNGDEFVIFSSKALAEKPIEVINTEAPFLADKLREEKTAVWNEALEFLGINTNPSDKKKERLIVNEVNSNNEQIDLQFATMYLTRQQACEKINKMFGLNVSVKPRIEELKIIKGEKENGKIYD